MLETVFLVMFWVGLALTVLMALMSGAFHHEISSGSSFEGGVAHDLGGGQIAPGHDAGLHAAKAEVGWSHGELPGISPWSPTVVCATLTGAGGIGWLSLTQWTFGAGASLVFALVGGVGLGGLTFGTLAWIFKHVQSSSVINVADLVGTRARVDTSIDPGTSGAIVIEAAGGRMVVPARSVDAAAIPVGAEIEIVRVDGSGYHVKETRESWLARSKSAAR